jgi:hypothetical protein
MDPDDLKMFPTDDVGVAQGCPLSAFAGNVVLRKFDQVFNGRGITCIRYIDDFILLGRNKAPVAKAFESAGHHLATMEMSVYKPEDRPDKAFFGKFDDGFDFLGYQLLPGTYPPTHKNRRRILKSIEEEFNQGRAHILRALHRNTDGKTLQFYAQTLVAVDRLLRAWSGSFGASHCITTATQIDDAINEQISGFIAFYQQNVAGRAKVERRRVLGVHALVDDVQRRLRDQV